MNLRMMIDYEFSTLTMKTEPSTNGNCRRLNDKLNNLFRGPKSGKEIIKRHDDAISKVQEYNDLGIII